MAQNEMKAKPALPERVRSMEGLDGILETLHFCLTIASSDEQEEELRGVEDKRG